MSIKMNVAQIQEQLQKVREVHGEEIFQQTRRDMALSVIFDPNGEAFVKNAFPDLNIEELKAEAAKKTTSPAIDPGASPEELMLRMLQQQMPSIKTQGHYNLFAAAFDALRTTLDGYFSGNLDKATKAREVLNKTLDTAGKANEIFEKLREMSPEERSTKANEFLESPKEFHEYDTQRQLMAELVGLVSRGQLGNWYARTKDQRDRITSQKLRNELIDAIRKKRTELESQEAS